MKVHPRTVDIISPDYVPLYVSFATIYFTLPCFMPVILIGGLLFRPTPLRSTPLHSAPLRSTPLHSAPLRSTPLHSTRSLPSTPPVRPGPRLIMSATPTLRPSLPLPPSSLPPTSQCRPAPTTTNTPSLLAAEWPAHRGPELVASQYTARPCSASS